MIKQLSEHIETLTLRVTALENEVKNEYCRGQEYGWRVGYDEGYSDALHSTRESIEENNK